MSVWQAAFFALVQPTTHVNDIKRDLYSRRDLGPLAWWLVARLASFVDQTFCEKAATRGLDKHRREALLVDARGLLDPQSSVGRGLRHMLGTAAKLTDEEFKTLGNFAAKLSLPLGRLFRYPDTPHQKRQRICRRTFDGFVDLHMVHKVVHRACHRPIQRLGEAHRAAGRGDEPLIRKRLPVVFHELPHRAQRPLDEPAVVGDPLAVHQARVQRSRVAHDDVLSPIPVELYGLELLPTPQQAQNFRLHLDDIGLLELGQAGTNAVRQVFMPYI